MNRRTLLAGMAIVGAAPMASAQSAKPAMMPMKPMTNPADVKMAAQYYVGVLGPAEISLATSQMAVEKATSKNTHEFAGFELGEAITVNMVLKDIGAKSPAMDTTAISMIEKMKAEKGASFDRAYIAFQLENHQNLRDLADAYLHNSAGASAPEEQQGRHLAMLMLAVFKEHVAICKRITAELKA